MERKKIKSTLFSFNLVLISLRVTLKPLDIAERGMVLENSTISKLGLIRISPRKHLMFQWEPLALNVEDGLPLSMKLMANENVCKL